MRQEILANRVPSVASPHLDGAKILKRQRMVERGFRSLQRERRLTDATRIVAQPMRQRDDQTIRFIVGIAGKPEASLGDLQRVVMRRRFLQRFGEHQRCIGLLERFERVLDGPPVSAPA